MPICELERKWWGMNFNIACEEMRRLKRKPTEEDQMKLYGLFKQAIHGDIPGKDYLTRADVKKNTTAAKRYDAWLANKGMTQEKGKAEYLTLAEEMIRKYHRSIVRSQYNSDVWSVDY